MKVLVFTTDVIPLHGLPTSGTALRTYGFIQGLRANGHQVTVSVPRSALTGMLKNIDQASLPPAVRNEIESLHPLAFDPTNQSYIVNELQPDLILCGHWPAYAFQTRPAQPVVVDLAGPHLLERHYQGTPNHLGAALSKLGVIASADHFIVSGPSQRRYFLAFAMRAGVTNPEKRMIEIAMPLSPDVPTRDFSGFPSAEYPRFIFGGVFLPWQDPSNALEQISESIAAKGRGKLTLIGGSHPNYKIKEGIYTKLFAALSKNPAVEKLPMLPYDEFQQHLSKSDVAVDLMKWNLERELAMTIRSTTYLWSGLPIIYNDYADLGRLIKRYDAGWTCSPSEPAQLRSIVEEIYRSPEVVRRKSENASRLAREVFAWDRAVQPLLTQLERQDAGAAKETDIVLDFPDRADLIVSDGKPVEQIFFTRVDGLTRIECRMATHGKEVSDPVRFALYEIEGEAPSSSQNRKLVAEKTAVGRELKNNEWFTLETAPISRSAGKTFALRIESSAAPATASVAPWAVRGRPFPLLTLSHGAQPIDDLSLCLRTTCTGSTT